VHALANVLRWSLFAVLALVAAIAMFENREPVSLAFLGWNTRELPVYWWLVTAFVFGGLCGWLIAGVGWLRARASTRRVETELAKNQAELDTLRRASPD
jgi:uncharacterized integral membrane protein